MLFNTSRETYVGVKVHPVACARIPVVGSERYLRNAVGEGGFKALRATFSIFTKTGSVDAGYFLHRGTLLSGWFSLFTSQGAFMLWSLLFKVKRTLSSGGLNLVSREAHPFSRVYGRSVRVSAYALREGVTYFDLHAQFTREGGAGFLDVPTIRRFAPFFETGVRTKNNLASVYEAGFFFPNSTNTTGLSQLDNRFLPHGQARPGPSQPGINARAYRPNTQRILSKGRFSGIDRLYGRLSTKLSQRGFYASRFVRGNLIKPGVQPSLSLFRTQGGAYRERFVAKHNPAAFQRSKATVLGHKVLARLRAKSLRFFKKDSKFLTHYGTKK